MKQYELTVVVSGKAGKTKKGVVSASVEKLLDLYKGKILEREELGEVALARRIKGMNSGNFIRYRLELNPEQVKDVKDKLRLEESVLKFILMK